MSEHITNEKLAKWNTRQDQARLRDNEKRAHELNATNIHIAGLKKKDKELKKLIAGLRGEIKILKAARVRQIKLNTNFAKLLKSPSLKKPWWKGMFK